MAFINGIPLNWDNIEDNGLFGKSRSGLEALLKNTTSANLYNKVGLPGDGLFPPAILNNNPLNEYEWKTYWSNELKDVFFGGFDNKASDYDDDIETYDETEIYKSLKPERRAFLYTDKNLTDKFDNGDIYRFEIKIFISGDGAKLLRAWKGALVQDNELLIFLENNTDDQASGTMLLAKAGKNVTGNIAKYAGNKALKDWVNTTYNISEAELKNLLVSAGKKGWFINALRKIINLQAKVIAWPVEKVSDLFFWIGETIADNLRISESAWKAQSDTAQLMQDHQAKLSELFKDFFKNWQDKQLQPGTQEEKTMSAYQKLMQQAFTEINEILKLYPDIAPEMLWAMVCGILNGIVELIAGVFTFIGLLLKLVAQGVKDSADVTAYFSYYIHLALEYSDNFAQAISKIKWKDVFEQAATAYYKFIYIEAPQLLVAAGASLIKVDTREIAYFTGYIAFNIIICFIPVADLIQITKVAKLAKPLQELFETILKLVKKTGRFTAQKASDIFTLFENFIDLLRKGTKEVSNFIKQVFEAIKKWIEELLGIEEPKGGKGPKGAGTIIGKYSKRAFDPEKAGGVILELVWKDAKITREGIEIIKKHISRFEFDEWNDRMIVRMEKILKRELKITDFDKRFFTHEIREFERYKALGYENTKHSIIPEIWNHTHSATLEDYKLYELIKYEGKTIRSLYHPEVQY